MLLLGIMMSSCPDKSPLQVEEEVEIKKGTAGYEISKRFSKDFAYYLLKERELHIGTSSFSGFDILLGESRYPIAPIEISQYFYPLLLDGKIDKVTFSTKSSSEEVTDLLRKKYEIGLGTEDDFYKAFLRNLFHVEDGNYLESLLKAFESDYSKYKKEVSNYLSLLGGAIILLKYAKNEYGIKNIVQQHEMFIKEVEKITNEMIGSLTADNISIETQNILLKTSSFQKTIEKLNKES